MDSIIVPKAEKPKKLKVCEYFVFEYLHTKKRVMCVTEGIVRPGTLKAFCPSEHDASKGEHGIYWEKSMVQKPTNIIHQGKAVWKGDYYLLGMAYLNPKYEAELDVMNAENPGALK